MTTPTTPDRRDFLCTCAAAYGAAAIAGPIAMATSSSPVNTKRNIKKSLKYPMVKEGASVLEKFQLLKDLGYDGVELDAPSNLDPDEVLAAKAETGLEIPGVIDSVHWRDTLSHPDSEVRDRGRKGLETALHDCKTYGGTTALLVPAVVNKEVSYDDAYRRSQEEIRKVLPLAKELDIKIAIENVWNSFLLSPMEAARYIDEFESDHIGWYFDVGNIVNYGWPEQWIRILGHRILKLDIKEFSRAKRDNEGLWKGFGVKLLEGDCDWPAVMAAVDEIGYEGWGSAEVGGGGRERLKEIADRMDRIFAS